MATANLYNSVLLCQHKHLFVAGGVFIRACWDRVCKNYGSAHWPNVCGAFGDMVTLVFWFLLGSRLPDLLWIWISDNPRNRRNQSCTF